MIEICCGTLKTNHCIGVDAFVDQISLDEMEEVLSSVARVLYVQGMWG